MLFLTRRASQLRIFNSKLPNLLLQGGVLVQNGSVRGFLALGVGLVRRSHHAGTGGSLRLEIRRLALALLLPEFADTLDNNKPGSQVANFFLSLLQLTATDSAVRLQSLDP